jgi:hypothetical protein
MLKILSTGFRFKISTKHTFNNNFSHGKSFQKFQNPYYKQFSIKSVAESKRLGVEKQDFFQSNFKIEDAPENISTVKYFKK